MGETGKKTFKEVKQLNAHKNIQPKYTAPSGREVGWQEEGMERFELRLKETRDSRVSSTTYVDMHVKFYNCVQSNNRERSDGVVITLNTPKAKKRKRRFTKL